MPRFRNSVDCPVDHACFRFAASAIELDSHLMPFQGDVDSGRLHQMPHRGHVGALA